MKELKKILQDYSPNFAILGEDDSSEETFDAEIEKMRISLNKLIKKEYNKILTILIVYIALMLIFTTGFLLYQQNALNNIATIFTITGLSPISFISTVKSYRQKINATIVLELITNLNKDSLNSVLSIFKSIIN
jgi:hypothetical protein